jgi:uncharacterized protein (TIGR02246 family)
MTELSPEAAMLVEHRCAKLMARYCHLVDARQDQAIAELFTPDGVLLRPEERLEGRDAILRFFQELPKVPRRHIASNIVVEAHTPDTASGFSYVTVHRGAESGEPSLEAPYLVAEYHDALVQQDGAWRFASRDTSAATQTDVSRPFVSKLHVVNKLVHL